ncbi:T5orf172 domain-containing protein [Leptolyngbya sp. PCC 7375]|nr:T5orf172 domain-containing protein [Leptolyngbya sp. PCC 7375]
MAYVLLLLSAGLAIALWQTYKKLQKRTAAYSLAQQEVKDADKRLRDADRKYGGLISRDDEIRKLDTQITVLRDRLKELNKQAQLEEQETSAKISDLKAKLEELEEKDILQEFGFYESKYDFGESQEYKNRLDRIRKDQKDLIKSKKAAICRINFTFEGSAKKGKKMTDSFLKIVLRAFNGDCDASISKVKYSNVKAMEQRIRRSHEALNKLSKITFCEITVEYLHLKFRELWLTHEYQEKKNQEKEEQRIIREQMREEEKALRELEKAKKEAEQEERRYQKALEKARKDVESATGDDQQKLLDQIKELQNRLTEAEVNKERAISQAQLTKLGHVYVISNIGSFGDNVYKIGMTRRLEPIDRVKELSNASVPFPFDVHAMIFCENAPELELRLHKKFADKRINKINSRKEFFRVTLDDIAKAVREVDEELKICKSEITFTKIAQADDYRKTLAQDNASTASL